MDYLNRTPEIRLKYRNGGMKKVKITKSQDSEAFLREIFNKDTLEICEESFVLYLNQQCETIGWFKVSQGGIAGTIVDIRLIMHNAVKLLCKSIVLAHNHPSGTLQASEQDIQMTRRLRDACRLFDMEVLDHIILTADGYHSMADAGQIY